MPVYGRMNEFMQRVRATNWKYYEKKSSLADLMGVLKDQAGTAGQVVNAITALTQTNDATYGTKARKYKNALHHLMRTYPVPQAQWVQLGATDRGRAVRYTQVAVPQPFNPYGPGMYNNVARLQPPSQWEAGSVEDFVYTAPGPVRAVLIHLDAVQPGMETLIDGMKVVDHMKSVLRAVHHRGGNACVLHIGNTDPVCAELRPEINAFANTVTVNEPGQRHMGGYHQAFRDFVNGAGTVVVMGFDADICVSGNLFGATEYPDNPVAGANGAPGTSSITPITAQADVITSRALVVTVGTINRAEYGLIQGL